MNYTIAKQILAILAADSSLYAGGTAYASGWSGVKTCYAGQSAATGYINLHKTKEKSEAARPAVYLGLQGMKWTERVEADTVNPNGTQLKCLTIPIVIVCKGASASLMDSEAQAEQLSANINSILMKQANRVQTSYWTLLTVKGLRETESGTGGASTDAAEARLIMDIEVRYFRSATSGA